MANSQFIESSVEEFEAPVWNYPGKVTAVTNRVLALEPTQDLTLPIELWDIQSQKKSEIPRDLNKLTMLFPMPNGEEFLVLTNNQLSIHTRTARIETISLNRILRSEATPEMHHAALSQDGTRLAILMNGERQMSNIFILNLQTSTFQEKKYIEKFVRIFFKNNSELVALRENARTNNLTPHVVDIESKSQSRECTITKTAGLNYPIDAALFWPDQPYCVMTNTMTCHATFFWVRNSATPLNPFTVFEMKPDNAFTSVFECEEMVTPLPFRLASIRVQNQAPVDLDLLGNDSIVYSSHGCIKMLTRNEKNEMKPHDVSAPKFSQQCVFADGRVGFFGGNESKNKLTVHTFPHVKKFHDAEQKKAEDHLFTKLEPLMEPCRFPRGVGQIVAGYCASRFFSHAETAWGTLVAEMRLILKRLG